MASATTELPRLRAAEGIWPHVFAASRPAATGGALLCITRARIDERVERLDAAVEEWGGEPGVAG